MCFLIHKLSKEMRRSAFNLLKISARKQPELSAIIGKAILLIPPHNRDAMEITGISRALARIGSYCPVLHVLPSVLSE